MKNSGPALVIVPALIVVWVYKISRYFAACR